MNVCTECGLDFVTVDAFDEHRTGVHAYSYREGLAMDVEDGRRCFDQAELADEGWTQDSKGRWSYPADWIKQAWQWDTATGEAEAQQDAPVASDGQKPRTSGVPEQTALALDKEAN